MQASPTSSKSPGCSVVIPCFNASQTIEATLASAQSQTSRDCEIIVVDDGSCDATPDLVAAAARTDDRVQLIRQQNAGVSAARNAGISRARARIVALLDADDLWAPDHLLTHLRRLRENVLLGVSYSPTRLIDHQGRVIGQSRPKLDPLTPADLLCGNPTTTCSTLVVRRDVFKDAGLFRTDMRHNEDQEWLFRVAMSGWILAGDPVARVDYRTSPNGLASDLDGMWRGFEIMMAEAQKEAPVLVARNRARATASMRRYLARRAIRLGLPMEIGRRHMIAALAASPIIAFTEPVETLATAAAVLLPNFVLGPVLHTLRPRTAHA